MQKQNSPQIDAKISKNLVKVFYMYFVLLPMLSVLSLYFEKDVWNDFLHIFQTASGNVLNLFYHFYNLIVIAVSGVAVIVLLKYIPIPKSKFLLLFVIFDTPVTLFVNFLFGYKFSFADIFMFDFVFEVVAFIIADIIISHNFKRFAVIGIYTFAVITSYFGIHVFYFLKDVNTNTLITIGVNLVLSVGAYIGILKQQKDKDIELTETQRKLVPIAGLMGFFAVSFLIIVYVISIFSAMAKM